jgi:hypothetical protein
VRLLPGQVYERAAPRSSLLTDSVQNNSALAVLICVQCAYFLPPSPSALFAPFAVSYA